MRAFGRHVVMNSVTGVILPNHGFAVSFNNVSACNDRAQIFPRRANFPVVLVNPIKFRPQNIIPFTVFVPRKGIQVGKRGYDFRMTRRDLDFETSWRRTLPAPTSPRLDLRRLFFNRDADHRQRHSCRSVLSQQPLKYIVHGFCIARPTIREIKNACAHRGGEGGNFCFFVVASKRIATYDAAMVNTGCNRDVIGQSCYRVAPWNRKKK